MHMVIPFTVCHRKRQWDTVHIAQAFALKGLDILSELMVNFILAVLFTCCLSEKIKHFCFPKLALSGI